MTASVSIARWKFRVGPAGFTLHQTSPPAPVQQASRCFPMARIFFLGSKTVSDGIIVPTFGRFNVQTFGDLSSHFPARRGRVAGPRRSGIEVV